MIVLGHGCCFLFHRAARSQAWAGLPNRGFYLDVEYLDRLIRHVQRTGWDIVTLDEALRRTREGHGRRFINFSLDDCYRDTAEVVVPLFRRLGAPITLFVTTGIPDETLRLFYAGLETIIQREEQIIDNDDRFDITSPAQKRAAFAAIVRRWDEAGDHAASYVRFCVRHGYDADALDAQHRITWPMLEAMRADPLVEFGGHTVSHPHVAALDRGQATAELTGCRARLEAALDQPILHFAFPYGQPSDCGPRDFELARAAGFHTAATTSAGLLRRGTDPFRLPRNTINGEHRALPYAYAHLTGLSGLAHKVLRRV